MGALFGSLCAVFIGISDLLARLTMRRTTALTTSFTVQAIAIPTSLVLIAIFGGTFTGRDLWIGLCSGLGLGLGMVMYYAAMHRSSAAVVSPTCAVISAVIPYAYTLVKGAEPSLLAAAGAVVATIGIVAVTMGGGAVVDVRNGLVWGGIAGIAYGVGFAIVIEASDEAGSWPAMSQRIGATALLGLLAVRQGVPLSPPAGIRMIAVLGGVAAAISTAAYLVGIRADATAAVVTSSMFPAASVATCYLGLREPVTRPQLVGIAVVLAGIAGVALG